MVDGSSASHAPASRFRAGEVVAGKYRLVERVGRGGMGEVWLAEHDGLGVELALKFPSALPDDDAAAEHLLSRFRFEAQVSARLAAATAHVVAVHDAGTHEGVPYMAMEYVRGRGLDEELERDGAIAPSRLAEILDRIGDALGAAHAHGIVHRDLKPSNILLADDGELVVKLCDFGVAKATRSELPVARPKETSRGRLVGSPAYASPEQLRGAALDARSDVWSLGVVAYEALTGFQPFSGATMADLVGAIAGRDPDPPSAIRGELGAAIDAWMARALAKDPGDRFGSVEEMAAAFRAALVRPRLSSRAWVRWSLVAAALSCAGAIGAAAVLRGRHPPTRAVAPRAHTAQTGSDVVAAAAPADEGGRASATAEPRAALASAVGVQGSTARGAAAPTPASATPTAERAPAARRTARGAIDPSEIQ